MSAHHPPYNEMVVEAITELKEKKGSSRQAIAKYISENFEVSPRFEVHMKQALKRLVKKRVLVQTKGTGASGSFMISKKLKDEAEDVTAGESGKKTGAGPRAKKKGTAADGGSSEDANEDVVSDKELQDSKTEEKPRVTRQGLKTAAEKANGAKMSLRTRQENK